MISTLRSSVSPFPLEVHRDGHVIFTYGYGGAGPVLECVEALGSHLEGTRVRTVEVDLTSARLLVFAEVSCVETDRITAGGLGVLANAGVEVRAGGVMESEDEAVSVPFTDLADFYHRLRVSPDRLNLAWIA